MGWVVVMCVLAHLDAELVAPHADHPHLLVGALRHVALRMEIARLLDGGGGGWDWGEGRGRAWTRDKR